MINLTMNQFITSKLTNGKGSHTLMFHEGFQSSMATTSILTNGKGIHTLMFQYLDVVFH